MQSPGRSSDDGHPFQASHSDGDPVLIAEFAALRTEIDRRAGIQWNVLALQITSAGAVAGVAISRAADPALLLIIPLVSYMFGSRYILHDFHIKLIHQYIRGSLSGRLHGRLAWEQWKLDARAQSGQTGWFQVAGWKITHPTRLAFVGAATLALVAAAIANTYRWWDDSPHWVSIVGFALLWILGAVATYLLNRSFDAASGTDAVSLPDTT